jgi:hypothetical protein
MPSRGIGIGAASKPMSEYDRTRGDRVGYFWVIRRPTDRTSLRTFSHDTNHWKSFVHARLATAIGDPGALSFFGTDPEQHRLIADHLTAETPIRTAGQGRVLDEWKINPSKPDNHWADCVTGCAAAASLCGAALPGSNSVAACPRVRVSFAALQRQAMRR